MYQEKMAELNEEAIMIANGTHPELITLMAEIEEKKGRRISTAEAWRKCQHTNFRRQFEGFEYQANVHFIVSFYSILWEETFLQVVDIVKEIGDTKGITHHYTREALAFGR